jgi:hypothetical protein
MQGWTVDPDPAKAPFISGVAVVWKHMQGMANIIGQHQTGRKKYTISMEVLYPFDEAGFALVGTPGEFTATTPRDMLDAGFEYVPHNQAPPELISTFSRKRNRVVAQYKGRKVFVLMGGLNNPVHYQGLGVVAFGAEPPAKITRLAASREHPQLDPIADSLHSKVDSLLPSGAG